MEIYIKPVEKIQLIKEHNLYLKKVMEFFVSDHEQIENVGNIIVFQVKENKDKTYLLSSIDIMTAIHKQYPHASVINWGETDILVEFHVEEKKEKPWLIGSKVAFVATILFAGAATTIMCFQSDGQLPMIFENYYKILTGEEKEMPMILSLPYTIGLGVGIGVFFNHFSKISLSDDPTPIEIEMTTYEKQANASIVDHLNRMKNSGEE